MTRRDQLLCGLRGPVIWLALVVLLTVASVKTNQATAPVVEINGGQVRGLVRNTVDGHRVNLYQGIRYGRAERFCRPTPVEPWTGIYEATVPGNACPQSDLNMTTFKQNLDRMSEDCLFLDVWHPAVKLSQKRSVMVWIHGGGFMMGSACQYDLAQFAGQGDVVVVSINYRLGPLAFVNGGTELESGNLALYDQILALEWVQQNVDQFGGNLQDVTIFGESGGGWAVGLLSLSPLTKGLFHRAILQSGAPYDNLFPDSKKESQQRTLKFAKKMDCLKENDEEQNIEQSLTSALSCLREKPASDLVKFSVKGTDLTNMLYPYHGDQFLPLSIEQSLKQFDRKLDVLFGVTRDEGSIMLILQLPEKNLMDITLDSARETIRELTKLSKLPNADLIVEHYTKHLTQDSSKDELRSAVFDIPGDYMLVCPTVLFGQQIARRMSYNKENHFYAYRLMAPIETLPAWMGVTHGQDLSYLFNIDIMGELPQNSKSFNKLSRDMVTAWTEFAKTGQISPVSGVEWTEAIDRQQPEQSSVRYFSLDSADYKMVDDYWKVTCEQFWKPIISSTKNTVGDTSAKTEL